MKKTNRYYSIHVYLNKEELNIINSLCGILDESKSQIIKRSLIEFDKLLQYKELNDFYKDSYKNLVKDIRKDTTK